MFDIARHVIDIWISIAVMVIRDKWDTDQEAIDLPDNVSVGLDIISIHIPERLNASIDL